MFYQKNRYNGAEYTYADRTNESKKRRAMIEYVMLDGTTSSLECAHQLGKLCENRQLLVNLIPYNQTDVKDALRCPSEDHMKEFQNIVSSYNTLCTIRRTMGADIASACGQLVVAKNKAGHRNVDIEDVGIDTSRHEVVGSKSVALMKEGIETKTKNTVVEKSKSKKLDTKVDLERWIKPLMVATALAASSFVISSILYFSHRWRDRSAKQ